MTGFEIPKAEKRPIVIKQLRSLKDHGQNCKKKIPTKEQIERAILIGHKLIKGR